MERKRLSAGVIGLDIMGGNFARHLVAAGVGTVGHKVPREIPAHDAKADYPRAEPFAFHNGAYASIEG